MGLFTQRPEEPSEWAGLPSEPVRPETAAERLGDSVPAGLGLGGLLGDAPGAVSSIELPISSPSSDDDGEDEDAVEP